MSLENSENPTPPQISGRESVPDVEEVTNTWDAPASLVVNENQTLDDSMMLADGRPFDAAEEALKEVNSASRDDSMMLAMGAEFEIKLTQSDPESWLELPPAIFSKKAVWDMMQGIHTTCLSICPDIRSLIKVSTHMQIGPNWGKLWAALDLSRVPKGVLPLVKATARAVFCETFDPTDRERASHFDLSDSDRMPADFESQVGHFQHDVEQEADGHKLAMPQHLQLVVDLLDIGPEQRAAALEKIMLEGRDLNRSMSKSTEIKSVELKLGDESLLQRAGMPSWKPAVPFVKDLPPQRAFLCGIHLRRKRIELALEEQKGRVIQVSYMDQSLYEAIHDTYIHANTVRKSNLRSDPAFDFDTGFPRVVVELNSVEKEDRFTYRLLQIRPYGTLDFGTSLAIAPKCI